MKATDFLGYLFSESAVLTENAALFRLLLSMIIGSILGFERARKLRPAGLRTYMLVCMGACLVMVAGLLLFEQHDRSFDPARMAAQVVSGIGFLGAGTIMVTPKHRIKGLTTAAGLWASACLGITIGCGFYKLSLGAFLLLLMTMLLADKLELLYYKKLRRVNLGVILSSLDVLKAVSAAMEKEGVQLTAVEFTDSIYKEGVAITCNARLHKRIAHDKVEQMLRNYDGVIFVERLDL